MKRFCDLKKRPILFVTLLFIFIISIYLLTQFLLMTIPLKKNDQTKPLSLESGWQYKIDSANAENDPGSKDWHDFKMGSGPVNDTGESQTIWFRVQLPASGNWKNPAIYFEEVYSENFDVFIGNTHLYSYEINKTKFLTTDSASKNTFTIALGAGDYLGKTLKLCLKSKYNTVGIFKKVTIGEFSELEKLLIKKDFDSMVLGFFFIILGLFIIPNVIFLENKEVRSVIYLSLFIFSLGVFIISTTSSVKSILLVNMTFWLIVNLVSGPLILVFFMLFFKQIFMNQTGKTVLKIWRVCFISSISFIFLVPGLIFLNLPISYLFGGLFYLLGIFVLLFQIVLVAMKAIKRDVDSQIFMGGFCIFAVVTAGEVFVFLLSKRPPSLYKWDMLIFIASLFLILGRRFSSAHDQLRVYSHELKTKNETLESMWEELKRSKDEVDQLNRTLEQRVVDRTMELERAMESLIKTQEQLIQSEKMAALGGLVVGVAHEINTPVGVSVTAASHLAKQTKEIADSYARNQMKKSEFENYISMCNQSSEILQFNLERAAELVRSFKKIAVDQSSEMIRTFKIKDYIEEILLSLSPETKKMQHHILVNCPNDLELLGDPGAFAQIVTNLVMNSVAHAFEEGEKGSIQFDIEEKPEEIVLIYSDNGKGMDKETLDQIFNPFYTTKRNKGGTGLGLNILYNNVTQKFNGTVKCESEPGKGTKFIIAMKGKKLK